MTKILFLICASILFGFSFALAHEGDIAQEGEQGIGQEVKRFTREAVEQFRQQREAARQQFEARKEEFRTALQAKREDLKTSLEAQKTELRENLKRIKDARKQATLERLFAKLNELNEKKTAHFSGVLNQIEEVVSRITSRTDKAAANGVDVAAVRTALGAATQEIADARAAVAAQAGKVYSFQVSTEARAKEEVKEARQALRADLDAAREAVRAARDAAKQAAVALAQIPKVNELEEPEQESEE